MRLGFYGRNSLMISINSSKPDLSRCLEHILTIQRGGGQEPFVTWFRMCGMGQAVRLWMADVIHIFV